MTRVVTCGGWAPASVFGAHVILHRVFGLYARWPSADVPMHVLGGASIAYFVSRCFRALPHAEVSRSRVNVLECLLAFALTVTVAVFWELAEFTLDRAIGSTLQVSLADTMKDLAMGIVGATAVVVVRARQLRAGAADVRALATAWLQSESM